MYRITSPHRYNRYLYPTTSGSNVYAADSVYDALRQSGRRLWWDADGNLSREYYRYRPSLGVEERMERRLCHTEEGMMQGYWQDDNDETVGAWNAYDAEGRRALKYASERAAGSAQSVVELCDPVYYVSPLVTLTKRGYTKHYFEGERRICSAIGGGFTHVEWDSIDASQDKVVAPICDELFPLLDDGVEEAMHCVELNDIHLSGRLIYRMLWLEATKSHDDPEPVYYYHNDHLGGTAYLTDQTGQVAQTLAYLPYGEDWVDVTTFQYDTSQIGFYQFNGKEKDPETDYLYYGARYHWPDVWNGWLSPDPLMDEYPSISPYAYCAWNPVNLVDPDGMETDDWEVDKNGNITRCKDQSHSIEGKDRLFSGKAQFDKNGNPRNNYVEASEGTFGEYNDKTERGIFQYNLTYEDIDGNNVPYNPYEIVFNEGSIDKSERKATEVFEFLSINTNVEWTLFGLGSQESSGVFSARITTSRMHGFDPYASGRAKRLGNAVKYAFHPHKNAYGSSPGYDSEFRKILPNATLGIFHTWTGHYVDFDGNIIDGPRK